MQSGPSARALCVPSVNGRAGGVGRSHSVARCDIPFRYHLTIDAEITMTEAPHQCLRNGKIADAGGRIDLSGGAADDTLDDFEPCAFPDRHFPPDQIEFVPSRPAA